MNFYVYFTRKKQNACIIWMFFVLVIPHISYSKLRSGFKYLLYIDASLEVPGALLIYLKLVPCNP